MSCSTVSVIIMYINCYSVNLATGVMNAFTAAKLIAILIVIVGGTLKLMQGAFSLNTHDIKSTTFNWQ